MPVEIRALAEADRAAWERLYAAYADFYEVDQTPEMRRTVWAWVFDPAHALEALVAADPAGTPVGLAHFRPFARPLSASAGGFLDDLFVDPSARGQGVADALIGALRDAGRQRGWTVLRWITAEDNHRARAVYDRLAERTRWTTYDIRL